VCVCVGVGGVGCVWGVGLVVVGGGGVFLGVLGGFFWWGLGCFLGVGWWGGLFVVVGGGLCVGLGFVGFGGWFVFVWGLCGVLVFCLFVLLGNSLF
ncbi:hypothetical protein, partial [Neisseria sp. P0024.S006]|uniref:hypothetical protein n=1 Tax=Neisseria sp. P0024.S006 TaxID=3436850 RepID=UPI003F7D1907